MGGGGGGGRLYSSSDCLLYNFRLKYSGTTKFGGFSYNLMENTILNMIMTIFTLSEVIRPYLEKPMPKSGLFALILP